MKRRRFLLAALGALVVPAPSQAMMLRAQHERVVLDIVRILRMAVPKAKQNAMPEGGKH